jgi:hypothetical protein
VADGSAARDLLGTGPRWTTEEIVRDLYEWATVTHLQPGSAAA